VYLIRAAVLHSDFDENDDHCVLLFMRLTALGRSARGARDCAWRKIAAMPPPVKLLACSRAVRYTRDTADRGERHWERRLKRLTFKTKPEHSKWDDLLAMWLEGRRQSSASTVVALRSLLSDLRRSHRAVLRRLDGAFVSCGTHAALARSAFW
jgi:hypothetical protein